MTDTEIASDRPKIFVCVRSRWPDGDVSCIGIAEDGHVLSGHLSSNEDWARHDMGVTPDGWKHDLYAKHYPDGYEVEWVPTDAVKARSHAGLEAALVANATLPKDAVENEA